MRRVAVICYPLLICIATVETQMPIFTITSCTVRMGAAMKLTSTTFKGAQTQQQYIDIQVQQDILYTASSF